MTSQETDSLSFDWAAALAYLGELSPESVQLPIGHVADAKIQPTIGSSAALLLDLLIRCHRPQSVLEIGTSLGYSACVMGRAALSYGGQVRTIEVDARLAEAARENVRALGLEQTVWIETANARERVHTLSGPFGVILQDGGKEDYLPMLDRLIELLEPGGLLVSDDVLFPVMNLPPHVEHWKRAIAEYNHVLATHPKLRTAWLPIGDGIAISVKLE